MKKLLALLRFRAAGLWRGLASFFSWSAHPVNVVAAWIAIVTAGYYTLHWLFPPTPEKGPVAPPRPPRPPPPPPPPPPPRTECTAAEETEAFDIMRRSIESDVGHYMRRPGEPQIMYRNCRLSGQRYEIVFKMNVPGTLCDDRLRYEAYYSGSWPVDGTRVRLERIGPEFAILLRQKRELRENPWMIPTCPR